MVIKTIPFILFLSFITAVHADHFFVGPNGNDTNPGRARAAPLKTLQKAHDAMQPGDTVFAMTGVYSNPPTLRNTWTAVLAIRKSGKPGKNICFTALPGNRPKIYFSDKAGILINGNYSYIDISGFEVRGNLSGYSQRFFDSTAKEAMALLPDEKAFGQKIADYMHEFSQTGILVAAESLPHTMRGRQFRQLPHHISVHDNYVHDCWNAGISFISADYVSCRDNIVHSCCWDWTGASGIFFCGAPSDSPAPKHPDYFWEPEKKPDEVRILISDNISYSNENRVPWAGWGANTEKQITDGNGLILDVWHSELNYRIRSWFHGRVRVERNIFMNNGGAGAVVNLGRHVDFIDNIAYMNNRTVFDRADKPEICPAGCQDVTILHNLMFPAVRKTINNGNGGDERGKEIFYDWNLYCNAEKIEKSGFNDITANLPPFRNPPRRFDFEPDSFRGGTLDLIANMQKRIRNAFALDTSNPACKKYLKFPGYTVWERSEKKHYNELEQCASMINFAKGYRFIEPKAASEALRKMHAAPDAFMSQFRKAKALIRANDIPGAQKASADLMGQLNLDYKRDFPKFKEACVKYSDSLYFYYTDTFLPRKKLLNDPNFLKELWFAQTCLEEENFSEFKNNADIFAAKISYPGASKGAKLKNRLYRLGEYYRFHPDESKKRMSTKGKSLEECVQTYKQADGDIDNGEYERAIKKINELNDILGLDPDNNF